MNDSYWLDAVLLYPPYLVALAAINLACAYLELDVSEWFDKLNVNRTEVSEGARWWLHSKLAGPPPTALWSLAVCRWTALWHAC